jgi:membrane-bound ClpP family serine protease
MEYLILVLVMVIVAFELIEHVMVPLIYYAITRKRTPISGVEAMPGQVVEVKSWDKTEGQVLFNGELWRAVSDVLMAPGDRAVIVEVERLTLKVRPLVERIHQK